MRSISGAIALLLVAAALPSSAAAADPGSNGRIAFSISGSGSADWVVTMNPGGGGQAAINQDGYEASWSPDGTMLAFFSLGQPQGIATMNADGSNVSPNAAANSSSATGASPFDQSSWSPDGKQLVFSANQQDATAPGRQLVIVNSDGSGQPSYLTPVMQQGVGNPSWSPSGNTIAFTEGGDEVEEVASDGSDLRPIHAGSEPDFSPDGTRIVFVSGNGDLWIMNADGSGAHALLTGSPCPCRDPHFSPDGSKIVFITGEPVVVATGAQSAARSSGQSAERDQSAARSIAEQSPTTTNSIEVVRAAGGSPTVTATCGEYVLSVSWQPLVAGTSPAQPTSSEQEQVCSPGVRTPKSTPSLSAYQTHRRLATGSLRVRIHGRLLLPSGVDPSNACSGMVTMWFLRANRQVARRVARVGRACRYSMTATFPRGVRPRSVIVRFDGNASMRPSDPYRLSIG